MKNEKNDSFINKISNYLFVSNNCGSMKKFISTYWNGLKNGLKNFNDFVMCNYGRSKINGLEIEPNDAYKRDSAVIGKVDNEAVIYLDRNWFDNAFGPLFGSKTVVKIKVHDYKKPDTGEAKLAEFEVTKDHPFFLFRSKGKRQITGEFVYSAEQKGIMPHYRYIKPENASSDKTDSKKTIKREMKIQKALLRHLAAGFMTTNDYAEKIGLSGKTQETLNSIAYTKFINEDIWDKRKNPPQISDVRTVDSIESPTMASAMKEYKRE